MPEPSRSTEPPDSPAPSGAVISSGAGVPTDVTESAESTDPRRLPGVEGLWVFIGVDMTFFLLLFMSFMVGRGDATEEYETARHALDPDFGGVNTLILLTSSWFVVLAVRAARNKRPEVSHWLLAAAFCGAAFGVLKVIEYSSKISDGLTPATNNFYMYYFALTGFHLMHVLAGTVMLLVFWTMSRKQPLNGKRFLALESGAAFWHMVDLLWIVLFPLLYLMR